MTGIELTNRLIDDINRIIFLRDKLPEPQKSIGLMGAKDFTLSLNIYNMVESELDKLSQFINNNNERLIDHNKNDDVDIFIFQRDILKNKKKIGDIFQEIIDGNIIDIVSGSSFSDFLIKKLDGINRLSTPY